MRICRDSEDGVMVTESISFDEMSMWELSLKIDSLHDKTLFQQAHPYVDIIHYTPSVHVSVVATENNLLFTINSVADGRSVLSINSEEVEALVRIMPSLLEHADHILQHQDVMMLMVDVIWFHLENAYRIVLPNYAFYLGINDEQGHINFDRVVGYFSTYTPTSTVIRDFRAQLLLLDRESRFCNLNIFNIIMGQMTTLKRRLLRDELPYVLV